VEKDVISRKEHNHDLFLGVDLDFAKTLVGKRVIYLGIPIFKIRPYAPPPGSRDTYQGLRKWYRNNIENPGGMFILHRRDLQRSLAKAQPDAIDYLVTEDEMERDKHQNWLEPGNEALEIDQWILPASAIDNALVATDFLFERIKITIIKSGVEIDEVYYSISRKERTLYYSHHRRQKKPVHVPASPRATASPE
jgi:hypothetical protein